MKAKAVFSEKNVFINKDIKSKNEILRDISRHLLESDVISSSDGFLNDILEREGRGSTFIYNYFAMPHGISKYVIKSRVVIYKLLNPINWDDNNNVKLIVLFTINNNNVDRDEKEIIRKFSTLLADESFIDDLLNCNDKFNVIKSISKSLNLL